MDWATNNNNRNIYKLHNVHIKAESEVLIN